MGLSRTVVVVGWVATVGAFQAYPHHPRPRVMPSHLWLLGSSSSSSSSSSVVEKGKRLEEELAAAKEQINKMRKQMEATQREHEMELDGVKATGKGHLEAAERDLRFVTEDYNKLQKSLKDEIKKVVLEKLELKAELLERIGVAERERDEAQKENEELENWFHKEMATLHASHANQTMEWEDRLKHEQDLRLQTRKRFEERQHQTAIKTQMEREEMHARFEEFRQNLVDQLQNRYEELERTNDRLDQTKKHNSWLVDRVSNMETNQSSLRYLTKQSFRVVKSRVGNLLSRLKRKMKQQPEAEETIAKKDQSPAVDE